LVSEAIGSGGTNDEPDELAPENVASPVVDARRAFVVHVSGFCAEGRPCMGISADGTDSAPHGVDAEFDTIASQSSSSSSSSKGGGSSRYYGSIRFASSAARRWRSRFRDRSQGSVDLSPDLRIIIMTMDRRQSFLRLWHSLEQARYLGDHIDVDVWVDRNGTGHVVDDIYLREISLREGNRKRS